MATDSPESRFGDWVAALDERHLADLTVPEVGRALKALSSCYVERRSRLAEGAALEGSGKRAAFALFYAPLHFQVTLHIVRQLAGAAGVGEILDLGCGTGAAGAAWALAMPVPARVTGFDRNAWAIAEANWSYTRLGIRGRASRQDLTRAPLRPQGGAGILAAYAINELDDLARSALLPRLVDAGQRGAAILIVEPIARRVAPWWQSWQTAFTAAGGRADEWRFQAQLPPRQRQLAKSAGLDPRELTARTLFLRSGGAGAAREPYDRIPS
jgi:SAM-dependent methyltransferase